MLEMLSVLAILGILSISGIVGYQYAMRLYRIAETYDEVSVTISGGRTWPVLEHYGPLTKVANETGAPYPHADTLAYNVPIREVVSKVNYRNALTAAEALGESATDYYERREYEAFSSKIFAPVWVRAETPEAWSVRVTGLSYDMCASLVTKRELGYQYVYVALNDDSGNPVDPNYWDFPLVTSYSNSDIKDHDKVKALCEAIDPGHRSVPPAYTFQKNISLLNKDGSNITSVGECKIENGVPSVRCMAFSARVDNAPLQTLVFYWGAKAEDEPIPFETCRAGTMYDGDGNPSQYCCETEARGLWIDGPDICCALGESLPSPETVQIAGKYYRLDRDLTGKNTDGNDEPLCDDTPPTDNCCIGGTPWYVGDDPANIRGACKGNCPSGPVSATVPNRVEHSWCCETQAGGIWKLRPGSPSNARLPLSSSPKSPLNGSGGALCCWGGSGSVLAYDSSNPMSCFAPNVWSKKPPTLVTGVVNHPLKNTGMSCTKKGPNGGTSSDSDDDDDDDSTKTCPTGYTYSDAADSTGTIPAPGCIQQQTAMGYYWCCPDDSTNSNSRSVDNSLGDGSSKSRSYSNNSDFNDPDSGGSDFNDDDSCIVQPPLPPLDIYGNENTDCCPTEKKNGTYQINPYVGAKKVSPACCDAIPNMTTVYGKGGDRFCNSECCNSGEIKEGFANFQNDPTASRYRSGIFVNAKGASVPSMCCQLLDANGSSSKFQHPECCETDLAHDVGDEAGRWVGIGEITLNITVYDTETGTCTYQMISSAKNACCKKNENGYDIECNENVFCCGTDQEENKKSEVCCPLVTGHYWNAEKGECTPCSVPVDGCGPYCEEVGEHCCIKDINGCSEPYAWAPRGVTSSSSGVYIEQSCCHECINDTGKKFIGFTKAAYDKKDRIIGDCYNGFTLRSSTKH